jgi:hypothetical protein
MGEAGLPHDAGIHDASPQAYPAPLLATLTLDNDTSEGVSRCR